MFSECTEVGGLPSGRAAFGGLGRVPGRSSGRVQQGSPVLLGGGAAEVQSAWGEGTAALLGSEGAVEKQALL